VNGDVISNLSACGKLSKKDREQDKISFQILQSSLDLGSEIGGQRYGTSRGISKSEGV
jgi:hypothetical protein